jgi:hypothetical protein
MLFRVPRLPIWRTWSNPNKKAEPLLTLPALKIGLVLLIGKMPLNHLLTLRLLSVSTAAGSGPVPSLLFELDLGSNAGVI